MAGIPFTTFQSYFNYPAGMGFPANLIGTPLANGRIFFFLDASHTQPATVYQDQGLTIPYTNPIILSITGTVGIIYGNLKTYFVIVTDSNGDIGQPILTFPYNPPSGGTTPIVDGHFPYNLAPTFGFDSVLFEGVYDSQNPIPITASALSTTPITQGIFWDVVTTNANKKNYFTLTPLGALGLEGNPKNSLVLNSEDNVAGSDTVNRIRFIIGGYESFQRRNLGLRLTARILSGTAPNLPCYSYLTLKGAEQGGLFLGNLPISGTLVSSNIFWTQPPLTLSGFTTGDILGIYIDLPKSVSFSIEITGLWVQESPNATVNIHESTLGITSGTRFLSDYTRYNRPDFSSTTAGNSVTWANEGFGEYRDSGNITFSFDPGAPASGELPQRIKCDDSTIAIWQKLIDGVDGRKFTTSAVGQGIRSRRKFSVVYNTGAITTIVSNSVATIPLGTWASNNPTAISSTVLVNEFLYGVEASIAPASPADTFTGYRWDLLKFRWTAQGAVSTGVYNPNPGGGVIYPGPSDFEGGLTQNMMNYIGTMQWVNQDGGGGQTFATTALFKHGDTSIGGIGADGHSDFFLGLRSFLSKALPSPPLAGGTYAGDHLAHRGYQINNLHLQFKEEQLPNGIATTLAYPMNYLAWTIPGSPISPFSGSPNNVYPYVLNFAVEGASPSGVPTASTSNIEVPVFYQDSIKRIALRIKNFINRPREVQVTVNAVPNNGDYYDIDNGVDRIRIIFWDTGQAKPAKTGAVPNEVYMQFNNTFTTVNIAETLAGIFNILSSSCIDLRDIGFEIPYELSAYIKI